MCRAAKCVLLHPPFPVGVGHTFHDRDGDGAVTATDATLMAEVYGGVGEPDQPPPSGHLRPNPADDLTPAGAAVTLADAGGLQACYASSDGWCVALYDVDTSGAVDLTDVTRFAAQTALRGEFDPIIELNPFKSRFDNPFLWTGQRYDPTTRLYHFWARSYDPSCGRWLTCDALGPLEPAAISVAEAAPPSVFALSIKSSTEFCDGMNLYQYARSEPIGRFDAWGQFSFIDVTGSAGLSMDLEANNIDVGMSIAGAMEGLAAMFTDRNLMLEELTEVAIDAPDLSGLDTVLQLYAAYQTIQIARFGVGLLKAGRNFAKSGMNGLLRRLRFGSALKTGFKTGAEAADFLFRIIGGRREVTINKAKRRVDIISGNVAHEVKMGYQGYSAHLLEQIKKDKIIVDKQLEGVQRVHWDFFRSANTGKIGADKRILRELDKRGIGYTIHDH